MIVYDKEQKQIVIPNGLGNVNIVINQGGDCPECPELTEISITENGRYEGAYNVVNVDVPTEGGDKPTPPQDGWGMVGNFNDWGFTGGVLDIPFEEDGEWDGRPYKVIRNFEATGGEFKIRRNNDWTDSYTANFYDIPQFALLRKADWNMSIDDGVWDIYLFFGNDGVPNEMLILHTGTDLSTIKYEYTLTISTDKENAIIKIVDGYTGNYDRYCGGSATAPMKLGNSYSIGIYMEGYEDINEELACRNDEERTYTLTKIEGYGCNLISPIVFSKDAGNTINAKNVQIPTFVYEGNQYYNVDSFNLADIEEFKIQILFKSNNSGYDEPINIFGCENSEWDNTTFGARINSGFMEFKVVGNGREAPFGVDTWYNVEMGYNTTKKWVIVNGSTLFEEEHTALNKPSQTLMIGAINKGGNALRPFYGKIAATYIKSNANQVWLLPKEDGTMAVYWNNLINSRNSISGNNNARFENDNISGDGMKSITWLGNLEDKWVTPSMNDRDDNGYIVVSPSEGYSGLKRTVINPQTIYNEGLEAGRAEGGEGGSCNLVSRTFTSNGVYHPEAEQMQTIWFTADKPSAYDTGIKLVNDSWVEIYFRATEGGDTPTLIGCEDSDWSNTTFATRWFDNNLGVKMGGDEISIPYTAGDDKLHKLKFGRNVGVWFDDAKVSDIYGGEWILTDRTIYIGAMNDPSNNNEKGFWRPWVGYIGDVTIYGSLNENVAEYHFKAGDYGRWGEFKRVEDNTNLPNLGGDGMAIAQTGSYGEAPDGFSEVTVNVPQHNLGTLDWTLTSPSTEVKNASDDGYDGYSTVTIRPENIITEAKESAKNDFKNKMKEITITENGTYSIDDAELTHSIAFDGNSYFDTGIVPTENIKIEACIKITNGKDGGMGGIIIGGGIAPVDNSNNNSDENRGIAIGMGGGAIYGIWGAKKSENEPYKSEGEGTTTVILQKTDDSWYWPEGKGSFGASTLYIGGYNKNDEEVEEKFTQSIVYIKIWTNKDDDSTMTLFRPKNMAQGGFGLVNSEGVETGYIENLGSGTATFVEENMKKYPNGFKRVEVNVVPQISKIDIAGTGVKFGYSTFEQVPEWIDFSNVTDMVQMFRNCEKLITIPQLDTSNVTNMANMFAYCHNLTTIPLIDTSKVTDMSAMFFVCNNLTSIPQLDTSKVTNMYNMFFGCKNLTTVPQLDTSKVTDMSAMFEGCVLLTTIPKLDFSNVTNTENMFANCNDLTNLGGFINLKYSINLSASYKLTRESVLNIFNNMAEVTDNQTIYLNSAVYSHLTEEDISIATQKGWNVQEGAQPS